MPWYIAVPLAVILFILAPFFRKWVDVVLWPKVVDWWAARSQASLQKRIQELERQLTKQPDPLRLIIVKLGVGITSAIVWYGLAVSASFVFSSYDVSVLHDPKCTLCLWLFTPPFQYANYWFYVQLFVFVCYLVGTLSAMRVNTYAWRTLETLNLQRRRLLISHQLEVLRGKVK